MAAGNSLWPFLTSLLAETPLEPKCWFMSSFVTFHLMSWRGKEITNINRLHPNRFIFLHICLDKWPHCSCYWQLAYQTGRESILYLVNTLSSVPQSHMLLLVQRPSDLMKCSFVKGVEEDWTRPAPYDRGFIVVWQCCCLVSQKNSHWACPAASSCLRQTDRQSLALSCWAVRGRKFPALLLNTAALVGGRAG